MHPVDSVHVGQPGPAEHRRVPGRLPEARVGCEILRPGVCLHLDDPAGQRGRPVVTDEQGAEQAASGFHDRPGKDARQVRRRTLRHVARGRPGPQGKNARIPAGVIHAKSVRKAGISVVRKRVADCDGS